MTYVVSGRPDQSQPADLRVVWVGCNQSNGYSAERALCKLGLAALPVNWVIGPTDGHAGWVGSGFRLN